MDNENTELFPIHKVQNYWSIVLGKLSADRKQVRTHPCITQQWSIDHQLKVNDRIGYIEKRLCISGNQTITVALSNTFPPSVFNIREG